MWVSHGLKAFFKRGTWPVPLFFLACSSPQVESSEDPLVTKGRAVYQANCVACHNPNPALDGAVAPAVKGASKELLETRVVHGNYPEGYRPKRTSRLMVAMPHLAQDIAALAAYLKP